MDFRMAVLRAIRAGRGAETTPPRGLRKEAGFDREAGAVQTVSKSVIPPADKPREQAYPSSLNPGAVPLPNRSRSDADVVGS
jgi:hypothetical protein